MLPKLYDSFIEKKEIVKRELQPTEDQIRDLEKAENLLSENSFTIHNLFREMGQIFEALSCTQSQIGDIFSRYYEFPKMVASLIMAGFPVELMDGDACSIPMEWILSILNCLSFKLNSHKIVVVSVLGVESSGKSTLLNSMFGIQFAVSAGRCTRGVYAQLVPVAKTDRVPFSYVLVLDTEGIRTCEKADYSLKRDNEVATLVIGMSDITILNVNGENYTDNKDMIQIAVHAFLRMRVYNMKRKCKFVHQNVPAADVNEKLGGKRVKLITALNEAAVQAARLEKVHGINDFSQVIELNPEKDVFYFGHFWEGQPPMARVSPYYYHSVLSLKECIFDNSRASTEFRSMNEIQSDFTSIWNGILSEEFVFRFRNTERIRNFTTTEEQIVLSSVEINARLDTEFYEKAITEFNQCQDASKLEETELSLWRYMGEKIKFMISFTEGSDKDKHILSNTDAIKPVFRQIKSTIQTHKDRRLNELLGNKLNAKQKADLESEAKRIGFDLKSRGAWMSSSMIDMELKILWKKWQNKEQASISHNTEVQIRDMLLRYHSAHSKLVHQELRKISLSYPIGDSEEIKSIGMDIEVDDKCICFWSKQGDRSIGEESPMTKIKSILASIATYTDKCIEDEVWLSPSIVHAIFKYVSNQIEEHNSKDSSTYQFLPVCEVRLCIQALRHAIAAFNQKGFRQDRRQSGQYGSTFSYFRALVRTVETEYGLPGIVTSIIETHLLH